MDAPSILAISLTLDCDDQQKYDDDPASDYEIFYFHWLRYLSYASRALKSAIAASRVVLN
jgi:hypothetical protein